MIIIMICVYDHKKNTKTQNEDWSLSVIRVHQGDLLTHVHMMVMIMIMTMMTTTMITTTMRTMTIVMMIMTMTMTNSHDERQGKD